MVDTKDLALRVEPKFDDSQVWKVVGYSDSDFAGDKETRVSIAGFVIYLMDVPISWRCKGMKSVTLSSSEAEYVALSEAAKEIKFIYQLLRSMGVEVNLPIEVNVDNIGAIFMSGNVSVSQRTKHVDVRYRFVQEFVMDKFIKVVFVRTEENDADLFTKNLGGDLHEKQSAKLVSVKGSEGATSAKDCMTGRVLDGVIGPELSGTKSTGSGGTEATGKGIGEIGETTNTGGSTDGHCSDGSKGSYGYEGANRGKV